MMHQVWEESEQIADTNQTKYNAQHQCKRKQQIVNLELKPLWKKAGPEASHKIKVANHVRLFDAARAKVRVWEAAHAKDNVWNLTVQ